MYTFVARKPRPNVGCDPADLRFSVIYHRTDGSTKTAVGDIPGPDPSRVSQSNSAQNGTRELHLVRELDGPKRLGLFVCDRAWFTAPRMSLGRHRCPEH